MLTIDDYLGGFPADVQQVLRVLRATIQDAAPGAVEVISYRMPTFKHKGRNLVHFAACARHIGFYPTPSAIVAFQTELASYKTSKGAVQFPLEQPLPLPLIRRMVEFRVRENDSLPSAKRRKAREL